MLGSLHFHTYTHRLMVFYTRPVATHTFGVAFEIATVFRFALPNMVTIVVKVPEVIQLNCTIAVNIFRSGDSMGFFGFIWHGKVVKNQKGKRPQEHVPLLDGRAKKLISLFDFLCVCVHFLFVLFVQEVPKLLTMYVEHFCGSLSELNGKKVVKLKKFS